MILIIEDEEILRFTFKSFLTRQGHTVRTAADGDTALALIAQQPPELIIADIVLGGPSGLDILKQVKARGLTCPVVMITGKPSLETAAEAVRLGAYDYLIKPVEKEPLLKITEKALQYRSVLEEKHRIEAEKEKLHADLETIFASIQEGLVTVDSDMHVMRTNQAFERMCGPFPDDPTGIRFGDLVTHCRQTCLPVLEKALDTRQQVTAQQVACNKDDGTCQTLALTGSPLTDGSGRFSGAVLVIRDLTRESHLESELQQRRRFHGIIGASGRMQQIYSLLEDLADTDTTVLITGESGTGKELAASALHYRSRRADKPFVKVNCSALSDTLLESELFGHVKGAFTGAIQDKTGRFELADGGSILLDEIGDLSPRMQLKLLRVLQEKEFERVGQSHPVRVDIRIMATTHRDLTSMVAADRFRQDLYYRLKVLEVGLPPLRERISDIGLLVDHFCRQFSQRFEKQIQGVTEAVLTALSRYPWPGNVRELEHAIEHAFVLCHDDRIDIGHLPAEITGSDTCRQPTTEGRSPLDLDTIMAALEKTGGNKAKAARLLGINRRTIYRRLSADDPTC